MVDKKLKYEVNYVTKHKSDGGFEAFLSLQKELQRTHKKNIETVKQVNNQYKQQVSVFKALEQLFRRLNWGSTSKPQAMGRVAGNVASYALGKRTGKAASAGKQSTKEWLPFTEEPPPGPEWAEGTTDREKSIFNRKQKYGTKLSSIGYNLGSKINQDVGVKAAALGQKAGGALGGGVSKMTGLLSGIAGIVTMALPAILALIVGSSRMLQKTLGNILKFFLLLVRPIGDMIAVLLYPLMMLIRPLSLMINTMVRPYLQAARQSFRAGLKFYGEARKSQTTDLKMALTKWGDSAMVNGLFLLGVGFVKLLVKGFGEILKISLSNLFNLIKYILLAIKGVGDLIISGITAVLSIFGATGIGEALSEAWGKIFYNTRTDEETGDIIPTGLVSMMDWLNINVGNLVDSGVNLAMESLDSFGAGLIEQSEKYSILAGEVSATLAQINSAPIPNDLKINLEKTLADLLNKGTIDEVIKNVTAFNSAVSTEVEKLKTKIDEDLTFEFDLPDYTTFFDGIKSKFTEFGGTISTVLDNIIKKYTPGEETNDTSGATTGSGGGSGIIDNIMSLFTSVFTDLISPMDEFQKLIDGDLIGSIVDFVGGPWDELYVAVQGFNTLMNTHSEQLTTDLSNVETNSASLATELSNTTTPNMEKLGSATSTTTGIMLKFYDEANSKYTFIKNWKPPTSSSDSEGGKAIGGSVDQNGMYYLHRGETVTNPVDSSFKNTSGGSGGGNITINMQGSTFGNFNEWKREMDKYFSQQLRHMR